MYTLTWNTDDRSHSTACSDASTAKEIFQGLRKLYQARSCVTNHCARCYNQDGHPIDILSGQRCDDNEPTYSVLKHTNIKKT